MLTIQKLRKDSVELFKSRLNEIWASDQDTVSDIIHEVADNIIPVYTREILEVALSNLDLACSKSELWPAFWNDIPVNHIISNIYEDISIELQEWFNENN